MFSCFDIIPVYDRQTDILRQHSTHTGVRQTDIYLATAQYTLCIASCSKN